jgi:hypothetical protein
MSPLNSPDLPGLLCPSTPVDLERDVVLEMTRMEGKGNSWRNGASLFEVPPCPKGLQVFSGFIMYLIGLSPACWNTPENVVVIARQHRLSFSYKEAETISEFIANKWGGRETCCDLDVPKKRSSGREDDCISLSPLTKRQRSL